jgi:hypothetical protein
MESGVLMSFVIFFRCIGFPLYPNGTWGSYFPVIVFICIEFPPNSNGTWGSDIICNSLYICIEFVTQMEPEVLGSMLYV